MDPNLEGKMDNQGVQINTAVFVDSSVIQYMKHTPFYDFFLLFISVLFG